MQTETNDSIQDSVSEKMLQYMDRDYELRKLYLQHNHQELKQKKWKTRAFVVVFGLPLLFWIFVIGSATKNGAIMGDHVALVRINGLIGPDQSASANKLVPAIKNAFHNDRVKGILLLINSPGGTPVQSDIIYSNIKRLKAQYPNKQVIAIGEDMLTSGAYWVASSADHIYVNQSTITGSIGVIASSFAFDLRKFAHQYGLERRVQVSGSYKNRNDMFSPQSDQDIKKTDAILMRLHDHFKNAVLDERSGRLKVEVEQLFSGDYWTGDTAFEMGLVDNLGDLSTVLEDVFEIDKVKDYTPIQSVYDNIKQSFSAHTFWDLIVSMLTEVEGMRYIAR